MESCRGRSSSAAAGVGAALPCTACLPSPVGGGRAASLPLRVERQWHLRAVRVGSQHRPAPAGHVSLERDDRRRAVARRRAHLVVRRRRRRRVRHLEAASLLGRGRRAGRAGGPGGLLDGVRDRTDAVGGRHVERRRDLRVRRTAVGGDSCLRLGARRRGCRPVPRRPLRAPRALRARRLPAPRAACADGGRRCRRGPLGRRRPGVARRGVLPGGRASPRAARAGRSTDAAALGPRDGRRRTAQARARGRPVCRLVARRQPAGAGRGARPVDTAPRRARRCAHQRWTPRPAPSRTPRRDPTARSSSPGRRQRHPPRCGPPRARSC